jgi:hypothetical protein
VKAIVLCIDVVKKLNNKIAVPDCLTAQVQPDNGRKQLLLGFERMKTLTAAMTLKKTTSGTRHQCMKNR